MSEKCKVVVKRELKTAVPTLTRRGYVTRMSDVTLLEALERFAGYRFSHFLSCREPNSELPWNP